MGQKFELNFDGKENLEGKILIYSRLKCEPDTLQLIQLGDKQISAGNGHVFCTYNTTDARDLAEKMSVPSDQIDAIVTQIENQKEQFISAHPISEEDLGIHFCKISLAFESEDELSQFDCDMIYVGEYSSLRRCAQAVDKAEDIYLCALREQTLRKHDASEPSFSINTTHDCFKSKNIKEELFNRYVIPLQNAYSSNDLIKAQALKNNFINFAKNSFFSKDISDLCEIIEKNTANNAPYLIQAYVEKINAIHLEKYDVAAQMRDEIIKFLNDSNSA